MPLSSNHFELNKFSDLQDEDFEEVKAAIKNMVNNAPGIVERLSSRVSHLLPDSDLEALFG